MLLAAFGMRSAAGSDDLPSEYRIKAAYLYNLIKFVTWPDESTLKSGSSLALCIYGYNPFGTYLEKLEQRTVRNHPLDVRYVAEGESSAGCRVLFISRYNTSLPSDLQPVQATAVIETNSAMDSATENAKDDEAAAQPVSLTVGDDPDFLSHGGMIALVDASNSIHLDVHLTRARQLGLQFSANLLEIARRVE